MKHILTIFFFFAFAMTASAQNVKFGKPSKEDWELTSVEFAPDAEAVVLYKSIDLAYTVSGAFSPLGSGGEGSLDDNHFAASGTNKYISPEGTNMMYDVKVRVKILKDSGAKFASMDIIYLNDKKDLNINDEFYELSAVVMSNVNGKVKKKRVSAADIKDERINDNYSVRHVRVPEAKAGDIIEYQYKLFSNRITYIYDTQLQESIPVLYSKCRMEIPYFLQFDVNKPEIPNVTASAVLGQIQIGSPTNDLQLPRKCATNIFTIEAHNLPAYDGTIDLSNLSSGKVFCVRTKLKDMRYDVKPDVSGPVRHLIIGK